MLSRKELISGHTWIWFFFNYINIQGPFYPLVSVNAEPPFELIATNLSRKSDIFALEVHQCFLIFFNKIQLILTLHKAFHLCVSNAEEYFPKTIPWIPAIAILKALLSILHRSSHSLFSSQQQCFHCDTAFIRIFRLLEYFDCYVGATGNHKSC